ncbi:GCN5-related N-acetyltransferase 3, chloroplastic isoform X2 [Hevea brasiliensis]|uniref:GCN5-related N-acetyltransferase 3, chloroplastic isoform X2 n=1 Tax=Hevea brasiliensis TaxID=3981 RepID=UPI0025DC61F1|nr:GCN5-related N-acetyltransferase 3, chloroplastic isoform X2 [Hevea brasiliensis]
MEVAAVAMQMKGAARGYGIKTMEVRWATTKDYGKRLSSKLKSRRIPIYISTNPSDINPQDLRELCTTCNHSCHRFPAIDHNGKLVEAVDLKKLRLALSHSSVLVSVFCNLQDAVVDNNQPEEDPPSPPLMGLGDFLRRVTPLPLHLPVVSPSNSQLVGFGRAVSDFGLTASIYDVMVVPSLRRMGIGKMIVKRIIRMLTNREIYDIAALCSANERLKTFAISASQKSTMNLQRLSSSRVELQCVLN